MRTLEWRAVKTMSVYKFFVSLISILCWSSFFSADNPKNVNFTANVTSTETCLGWVVKFTCAADSNPAVETYSLYEDDTIVDMDVLGVWIRPLNKFGHVMYRCKANNSVGSGISNSITLTVGGNFFQQCLLLSEPNIKIIKFFARTYLYVFHQFSLYVILNYRIICIESMWRLCCKIVLLGTVLAP